MKKILQALLAIFLSMLSVLLLTDNFPKITAVFSQNKVVTPQTYLQLLYLIGTPLLIAIVAIVILVNYMVYKNVNHTATKKRN